MSSGRRLFVSSAMFGVTIAFVYWLSSRDATGTALLAVMAAALFFGAGYMFLAQRHADLVGDRERAEPGDEQGVRIGVFTLHSSWPVLAACGAFLLLAGLVISSALALIGFALLVWAIAGLIRESR